MREGTTVSPMKTVSIRLALIASASLAAFYALGRHVLRNWDESIYAEISKEMLNRRSWITPYFDSHPWMEKPPLFMWIEMLMFRFFGASETSARMLGAVCGVLAIWLTFEIGRRLMGDCGGTAAALILLTNGYFLFVSRFGSIDMPLTFCMTLAAYSYVRICQGTPQWWYLIGTAVGTAVMLKGAAAIVAPLAIGLALITDRRVADLRSREVRNSAILACAVAGPWHMAMLVLHGRRFLGEYFGYQVLRRASLGIEGHSQPVYIYLVEYWQLFLPFALLALVGVVLHIKGQRNSSIVVAFVLVITMCFSAAGTKLYTYVVPAFPFVSLLAVLALKQVTRDLRYALMLALVVFPLYWIGECQEKNNPFVANYSSKYVPPGPIRSHQDPLMRMIRRAQQSADKGPLIVCLDGALVEKQQLLFYSDRPVRETFLNVAPDPSRESPYWDPIPLDQVTGSAAPIIIRKDIYEELATSPRYDFTVLAQDGPLVLGTIRKL